MKNPVMFVVEIGSVITTIFCSRDLRASRRTSASICRSRCGCGSRCCSRTSPRRWRGPRQGAGRRVAQGEVGDDRCAVSTWTASTEEVPSSHLRAGDKVVVVAGADDSRRRRGDRRRRFGGRVGDYGRVCAGDSRGRRRSLGGYGRHARVSRDQIKVRDHVESGRDVPRSHDRAGRRRGAAEDAERDRAEHSAGWADDHLPACRGHAAAVCDLLDALRRRCSC